MIHAVNLGFARCAKGTARGWSALSCISVWSHCQDYWHLWELI